MILTTLESLYCTAYFILKVTLSERLNLGQNNILQTNEAHFKMIL